MSETTITKDAEDFPYFTVVLGEGKTSVWLTMDRFSIRLKRTDAGVRAEVYPYAGEMGPPINCMDHDRMR